MSQKKWKARWITPNGNQREYIFCGPESLMLARVDLQLKLMENDEPVPNEFELQEATMIEMTGNFIGKFGEV